MTVLLQLAVYVGSVLGQVSYHLLQLLTGLQIAVPHYLHTLVQLMGLVSYTQTSFIVFFDGGLVFELDTFFRLSMLMMAHWYPWKLTGLSYRLTGIVEGKTDCDPLHVTFLT